METKRDKSNEVAALMLKLHSDTKSDSDDLVFNEEKMNALLEQMNTTYEEITHIISKDVIEITAVTKLTPEWKFMSISFYILHLFKDELKNISMLLSTTSTSLRKGVENMMDIGISQNILQKLPYYKPLRKIDIDVKEKYYMLRASVLGLYHYSSCKSLKFHLFGTVLSRLLVGLFQLAYCPLAKPSENKEGSFVMTTDFYDEVYSDQMRCREIIYSIREKHSRPLILMNLALLMKPSNPRWFVSALVQHLNFCLQQNSGIKALFSLMGSVRTNEDSPKPEIVLGRLVSVTSKSEDFDSLILPQIVSLLYKNEDKGHLILFGEILKHTYENDELRGHLIVMKLTVPLTKLVRNTDCSNIDSQELSKGLISAIRVISYAFVNSSDKLPLKFFKNYMGILFNIYMFLEQNDPLLLKEDLRNIILEYLKSLSKTKSFLLFENLMFNLENREHKAALYNLIISPNNNELDIRFNEKNIKYDILLSARSILSLLESEAELENQFFAFLLSCLVESKKYFPDVSLLVAEDEGYLSTFERKIAVFEMLNILSSKDTVKKNFNKNFPRELLHYFNEIFNKAIETGAHDDPENDDYESVFTISLVLQEVCRGISHNSDDSELMNTVRILCDKTNNLELKTLLTKILEEGEDEQPMTNEFDEIEENIQNALSESIATQGHGLIVLKKMILSKHPKAIERKQFIFTIFKERLAHRDTYIYLAAINGVASFADLGTECTTMVLNTLCEEYREFPIEDFGPDATEMRLKIGEILVKISTKLGDMAPHYKALLLNTFLGGAKDEDHLIRASALSNLGEICKVLGCKGGSIFTEVIHCAQVVVNWDEHDEPRRAAIFLIRQLLVGLGKDMLSSLESDILVVYRSLKFLYKHDKDDILRLQCQLALEDMNTNMKEILMPQVEVNKTEKLVVLR